MSSETTKVVIEDRWVWYEKSDGEWQLFTRNGGNGEIRSRAVTSHVSPVRIGTLLDALSAAQRENEILREALVAIKQLCPYNLEIEYDTRHSGEPTAHVSMLYDEEDGYVLDREKVVSIIDAALSGQGGR